MITVRNPPPDNVRVYVSYDPDTGHFTRLMARKSTLIGDRADRIDSKGYGRVKINRRAYSAHRLAWFFAYGEWPAMFIDHINGDTSDNRISNLRLATNAQNVMNSKPYGKYAKGVHFSVRDQVFIAQIKCGGRYQRRLGSFDNEHDAHEAYKAAAKEYFGEYARFS